jgi:hypothetical protein
MSANPNERLRDIPALAADLSNVREVVEACREALQVARGFRGDSLDRMLTLRDLSLSVQQTVSDGGTIDTGSGGAPVPGPPGPPAPPAPPPTPDPTPPPTAEGLEVTAGLTGIFVSCDQPVYTQGHGHNTTVVYGAKWSFSDPTPPTFSEAVQLYEFEGTFSAYPSDLNTRWCIWIKWKSNDGYLSVSPAGGTNGEQATTGKIGNTDLNDLIVSADKLSAGTYPNINLVSNGSAEDGTVAWVLAQTTAGGGTLSVDTAIKFGGSQSFKITKAATTDGAAYACRAFPVIPGETYSVKLQARSSSAMAAGFYLRMWEGATKPSTGYLGHASSSLVDVAASNTDLVANGPLTTSFAKQEFTYTVPAGVFWVSMAVYNWTTSTPATTIYFDDCSAGRQITATFLAAGSIAAGSVAIADGAIRRALIEDAAIDNAKVANMAVDKLTGSAMRVGAFIQSTNYTGGPSGAGFRINADGTAELQAAYIRGLITASQINGNGLVIRDALGDPILGAGFPLAAGNISPAAGWLNSNISLNSNGTISGAGGGAVTLGGLGGGAFATLDQITPANATTYIASVAIPDALIANLNANKINAGTLRGINVNAASHTTRGSFFTVAPAAGAVTLTLHNTTDFPSSGSAMIFSASNDRDAFTYTGKTATTLTGCSGVLASHVIGDTVIPLNQKSITIDDATNEMRFFGDRGDGVEEELASIGIATVAGAPDPVIGKFGSALSSRIGVHGQANDTIAVYGQSATDAGVFGFSSSALGVSGSSLTGSGVLGITDGTTSSVAGVIGRAFNGGARAAVWGDASSSVPGVRGNSFSGFGVEAIGNATRAPMILNSAYTFASPPTVTTARSLAFIQTVSSGALHELCYADGTQWLRVRDNGSIFT